MAIVKFTIMQSLIKTPTVRHQHMNCIIPIRRMHILFSLVLIIVGDSTCLMTPLVAHLLIKLLIVFPCDLEGSRILFSSVNVTQFSETYDPNGCPSHIYPNFILIVTVYCEMLQKKNEPTLEPWVNVSCIVCSNLL